MSPTKENDSTSRSLSIVIVRSLTGLLVRCIATVSRWTRSLEHGGVVPVYDVIEAGPRHRFLTSGAILSNCVLGLGYGMGAAKFVDSCKSQGLDLPALPKAEWPELDRRLMFMIRNVARS